MVGLGALRFRLGLQRGNTRAAQDSPLQMLQHLPLPAVQGRLAGGAGPEPSWLLRAGTRPAAPARKLPDMPLLVEGRRLDPDRPLRELLRAFPELEEQAKQFRSQPAQAVGPKGLLYVQQREFAATTSKDGSVSILGSDDATTCHFVVLRHTGSGAICLTHCDGSDTETEVLLVINAVKVLSPSTDCGRLELHLIGGFCDDRRLSQRLTSQLLRAFDRLLDNVYLMTFCVTELNDLQENGRHLPYIYGIAANVKTGEIFHATFPDRGPDEDMRSARVLAGAKMISIYDSKKEQLCIGPYYWMPFPHVDFWLEQSNQSILQNLSTSPLAEPPHFVAHIRATLLYLREHPFPDKTLFPTQKPRLYKKNAEGLWERVSGQI
ncbi:protein N-terminal asparagine amidohydrolase [Crotalus adamanteus]|uniref:Protein N-terminal asparagine amidohydrolase n=2 Tax=Crotalus TaxID=8728 RepID=A0AAW1AUF2_CROAD